MRASKVVLWSLAFGLVAVTPLSVRAQDSDPGYSYAHIATAPVGTTEAQSVVVQDRLYLFGGFDVWKACCTPTSRAWVYDPTVNRWSALPAMPSHGISHAGIDSDGLRYVYYAGGYAADSTGTQQVYGTTDAFRYDLQTGTYARLPSLPQPRAAGGLAYVAGALYYFGGANFARTQDSADVWELDVANGATSWVSRAPLPNPRNHLGWAVIGGQVYVVGGQHLSDSTTAQDELDRYDPASNTWTRLPGLPFARSHVMDSTFVVGGRLVVVSGWTAASVSAAVTAFDPATGSWQTWRDLPQARTSAVAKALSGGRFVYCCGSAGTSNADGWLATPSTPVVATPVGPPPVGTPQPVPAPSPVLTPTPPTKPAPTAGLPRAVLSRVGVHPSTVASIAAGRAQLSYRLNRSVRVALVLRRCTTRGCTVVSRRTVGSPRGPTHISVLAITGRRALPDGHYRLTATPAGSHPATVSLVVRR